MPTNQEVLNSTNDLLKRVQTEGVEGTNLKPGAYNASTGVITPMKPATPIVPDLSGVNGTVASTNALIENFFKQQAETAAANKTAAETVQANRPKDWKSWLTSTGQQTQQDFATQQYNTLGYNPSDYFNALKVDTAEVDALNKDLTSTIAQRDQELNNISGRAIPMSEIIGSQALANRNWNIRINEKEGNINSKSAAMAAKQGNFTLAQGFVDKAVNAYTAQLTNDLNMTMKFYDDNQSLIDSLGKDYSTAITNLINTKQNELQTAREQKQQEFENALNLRQKNMEAGIGTTPTIGSNRFDNGLQSLLTTTPGLSAGQLYDLYIAQLTSNPTEKESQEIWARAKVIASQKPTTTTPASSPTATQVKGTGNFANTTIDDRITQLKSTLGTNATKTYLKEKLIKEGYPQQEVVNRTQDSMDKVGGFFQGVYNSIFGK